MAVDQSSRGMKYHHFPSVHKTRGTLKDSFSSSSLSTVSRKFADDSHKMGDISQPGSTGRSRMNISRVFLSGERRGGNEPRIEMFNSIAWRWENSRNLFASGKRLSFIINSIKKKKVEEKLSSYNEIVRLLDYDVLLFKWKLINSRGINFVNIRQD